MLNKGPVLGIFNIEPEMCYPLVPPGKGLDEMIINENDTGFYAAFVYGGTGNNINMTIDLPDALNAIAAFALEVEFVVPP